MAEASHATYPPSRKKTNLHQLVLALTRINKLVLRTILERGDDRAHVLAWFETEEKRRTNKMVLVVWRIKTIHTNKFVYFSTTCSIQRLPSAPYLYDKPSCCRACGRTCKSHTTQRKVVSLLASETRPPTTQLHHCFGHKFGHLAMSYTSCCGCCQCTRHTRREVVSYDRYVFLFCMLCVDTRYRMWSEEHEMHTCVVARSMSRLLSSTIDHVVMVMRR